MVYKQTLSPIFLGRVLDETERETMYKISTNDQHGSPKLMVG